MFKFQHCVASLLVLAGSASATLAQETRERVQPQERRAVDAQDRDTKQRSEADKAGSDRMILIPSTRAEGVTVTGSNGVRLGTVKDVVVRGHSGKVVYVLVTKGIKPAYTEVPSRVTAIPYAALSWNDDRQVLNLPITEEQFAAAPSFDADQWSGLNEPGRGTAAYKYFNVPEERAAQDRKMHRVGKLDGAHIDADKRDRPDGRDSLETRREVDKREGRDAQKPESRDVDKNPALTRNQEGRLNNDDRELSRVEQEGSLFRVSEIRSKSLTTQDGRSLGTVNDVIFDGASGRVAFLVITPASNLEAGDGRIGVPWPSFQVDQSGRLIANDLDRDVLRASPRFTQTEWSELQINGYTEDMYSRYGYETSGWNTSGVKSSSRDTQWRSRYQTAIKSGPSRTIKGTVESIDDHEAKDGMERTVVLKVKTDDGEVVTVHTAPQAYLDEHKCALSKGDRVTITGRTLDLDGKQCLAATELSTANGKRVVLHSSDDDTK